MLPKFLVPLVFEDHLLKVWSLMQLLALFLHIRKHQFGHHDSHLDWGSTGHNAAFSLQPSWRRDFGAE